MESSNQDSPGQGRPAELKKQSVHSIHYSGACLKVEKDVNGIMGSDIATSLVCAIPVGIVEINVIPVTPSFPVGIPMGKASVL